MSKKLHLFIQKIDFLLENEPLKGKSVFKVLNLAAFVPGDEMR